MTQGNDARAAIAERSRLFAEAYGKGAAKDLVAAYFAEDEFGPSASPPGGQKLVHGRVALAAMFEGMIPAMPKIRLETLDVTASDTVAFELGRALLTAADGTPAFGRYTVCWIKTPAGWRAKTDFFAADGWPDE